jgi:hypothetical protein
MSFGGRLETLDLSALLQTLSVGVASGRTAVPGNSIDTGLPVECPTGTGTSTDRGVRCQYARGFGALSPSGAGPASPASRAGSRPSSGPIASSRRARTGSERTSTAFMGGIRPDPPRCYVTV